MKRRKGKGVISFVSFVSFLMCLFLSVHAKALDYELDFEGEAQLIIRFGFMPENYTVSARNSFDNGQLISGLPKDYKVSATLLYMKLGDARLFGRNLIHSSEDMPKLQVSNAMTRKDWRFSHFNYTEDSRIHYEVSGGSYINITQEGPWRIGDEARVLLTIYYEAAACNWCSPQAFCCSDCKGCSSDSNKIDVKYWNDGKTRVFEFKEIQGSARQLPNQYRCIPLSLKCNGMPNCGLPYTGDESDCTEERCIYYECYWDMSYVWTALLAIVFFVISPTVVVFLICYHRQLTVLSRRRGIRRESDSSITVNSPPNDLPPTYDEITRGMEEPPPCFCRATSMISNSGGSLNGIDNPSFLSEDSMTVQKSGSIIAVSPASAVVCSCNNDNGVTTYNMPITTTSPAVLAPNAGLTNITSSPANNNPGSGDNDDKTGSQTQSQRSQIRNAHKRQQHHQNQRQHQESTENNLESHTHNMPNNNIDSHV